jgi:hypothetical protein
VKQITIVVVSALALAAFMAGCGGGGEAPVSLTKAQFIKQANAICSRGAARFNALYQSFVRKYPLPGGKRRSLDEYSEAVKTALAPAIKWELEEIRALGVPAGDAHTVDTILAAIEGGLEKVEKHPGVQANTERQFERSTNLANAYGLETCGS